MNSQSQMQESTQEKTRENTQENKQEITLVQALNNALAYELEHDPSVVVFGEDVGKNGGVFRVTQGLQQRFGTDRVLDTPLAENMIAGMSVGMAAFGLKPVAEIQFLGFIYSAMDQIISHATRLRNRTQGRLSCPMVIRTPFGAGVHAPEHHSESTEAMFVHIPGLRVVVPSSPLRAYGLLLAAIRDPDPVIFLEPTRLYRLVKQTVEDNGQALPLDCCFVDREGKDVTLVSWGAMMFETRKAAESLAAMGIDAEVIDVATLKPLDMETIFASVEKTGRCVIVHEAVKTCGVGAEIAAQLAEHALTSLLAPIQRVTSFNTIVPLYRLENYYFPNEARIIQAVQKVMEFS
jgi:2-oxoisovalerate dehydrogenase E1 component beta subunit